MVLFCRRWWCTVDVFYCRGVPPSSCGYYHYFLLSIRSLGEKFAFCPHLEVGGLSSPLSDVIIENSHFCQKGDFFDIIMALEFVWTPYLEDCIPFSNCSISWARGSVGYYGPIILTSFSSKLIESIALYLENRCSSMVSTDTCQKPVSWSTSGYSKTGSTAVVIFFFKALSMAVYFRNIAWFCRKFSVPSDCYWALPMLCG